MIKTTLSSNTVTLLKSIKEITELTRLFKVNKLKILFILLASHNITWHSLGYFRLPTTTLQVHKCLGGILKNTKYKQLYPNNP